MTAPAARPPATGAWVMSGLAAARPPGKADDVDQHELKAQCLALPGAGEEFPFGDEVSVFKVGGKMFALCNLDGEPLQLSVKCEPELAAQLRATYPAIAPGYHLNKRHWNTITLDGSLPDQMVADLLGDSYDLVVASLPKARRPA
jgi:predicted DNA-binding protein (MmcQ/YjbR family)